MRKLLLIVLTFLLMVTVAVRPAGAFLSDLAGHWASSMVAVLEAWGIVGGDDQGRFRPDSPLTRAQLAKLLTVGLGYESDADELRKYQSRYTDVPAWHWARGYVESFAELGITEGYPDGRFGPDEPVTRAQMAAFAVRALGLADRARLSNAEPTRYNDDANIPSWARGSIYVAYNEGIMMGLPDGNFYPNQSVTRAEGVATLYRILARKGAVLHLVGTLVEYDLNEGVGRVRDALGQERSFTIGIGAGFYRQGVRVRPDQIRLLDQVFIVLDENGDVEFIEARYQDMLVASAEPRADGISLAVAEDHQIVRRIQPGALVQLNGRPATLDQLRGAGPVYVVFDQTTGDIRVINAVRFDVTGLLANADGPELILLVDQETKRYTVAADAIFMVDGESVGMNDLIPGEEVSLALDAAGQVTYLEVTR